VKKNRTAVCVSVIVIASLLWGGCSNRYGNPANTDAGDTNSGAGTQKPAAPPEVAEDQDASADADLVLNSKNTADLGVSNPALIRFNGTEKPAVTDGLNATVTADTGNVIVALTAAGADIVLQGISSAGSVTFSGDYQANLYLNGLGLTNPGGAAINNDTGRTLTVTIVDGTTNRLIDSAESDDKAAFYSKGDLAFGGTGVLEVRGKAGHAIASKGAFTQTEGAIWVKEAVKDGINAKTVNISGGTFKARTKGDGIQGDDGVAITGGAFEIVTMAEQVKAHGVKSDGDIIIGTSGSSSPAPEMEITVYGKGSKCLSSDGDLTIAGGSLRLYTAGNGYWDTQSGGANKTTACAGIKCDGDLTIEGGDITVLRK
jgi:hypothetical protein